MFYWMKPLPEAKINYDEYKPFIKSSWLRKNFMIFVYSLQALIIVLSMFTSIWHYANIFIRILLFMAIYVIHELLHIVVVYKEGDLSLTHSGIFCWLNSDSHMSKMRFWTFMSLPLLVLTVLPLICLVVLNIISFTDTNITTLLLYIAIVNLIIAGSDVINSFLILIKPRHAIFL